MSRIKLHFTEETLAQLRKIKRARPGFTMRDASTRLGVSTTTLIKAAKRSGLRDELRGIFPPTVLNGNESTKRKVDMWGCMASVQVQWLTGNWGPG